MSRRLMRNCRQLVPMLLAVVSCTPRERGTHRWPEESRPVFSVSLPDSVSDVIAVDSVRLVPAPPMDFAATIEPDREHTRPLVASGTGESKVVTLAPASTVRHGDVLVSLRRTGSPDERWGVVAPSDGWWRPVRYAGESVWPGDTLGTVQSSGWYRAVGRVEDRGRSPARPGDFAAIVLPGLQGATVSGTVVSVSAGAYGGSDLSVHFQARPDTVLGSAIVQVSVVPRESLLVVPAAAVAQLSLGPAVFLPRGRGVYAVRLIVLDPHPSIGLVVHDGLEGPVSVATSSFDLLLRAAEESLSAFRRGTR